MTEGRHRTSGQKCPIPNGAFFYARSLSGIRKRGATVRYPRGFCGTGFAQFLSAVTKILLCSDNQILIRSLYGMLRDEGYVVDVAEHPSVAVQMSFAGDYSAVIMDSEPFGLSVEDAVRIIKTVLPGIIAIIVGTDTAGPDVLSLEAPIDLEQFKRTIRRINRTQSIH